MENKNMPSYLSTLISGGTWLRFLEWCNS